MLTRMRRLLGAPLAALLLGLAITGQAVAGGGPGPEPAPVNFYPDDPALGSVVVDQAGHAQLSGVVACAKAGQGTVRIWLTEYDAAGTLVAAGAGKRTAACPAGGSQRVTVEVLPEPGQRFAAGGTGGGFAEFAYDTVPEPGGAHYPGLMVAPLFDVRFLAA
jgi:hypothetical protein